MSSLLVRAMKSGIVVVQNRTNAEVVLRFVDHERNRVMRYLAPRASYELCPKQSPIIYLKFSNVKELLARRAIKIVSSKTEVE